MACLKLYKWSQTLSGNCLMSLPVRRWLMAIKFWIALSLQELQIPFWSLGTELHPCDLIHQLKKNWYSMEIYCQRPIHYLLLIDAESWSLKVEVNSSLSPIFNGKQSKGVGAGRTRGPFDEAPIDHSVTSPFGSGCVTEVWFIICPVQMGSSERFVVFTFIWLSTGDY